MENRVLTEAEGISAYGYEEHLKNEEIAWRQRSKALWQKEGVKNTKYIHKVANAHRCNIIDQLMIQDKKVRDPERIKRKITGFYQRLYSETSNRRTSSNLIICLMIAEAENEVLQRELRNKKY